MSKDSPLNEVKSAYRQYVIALLAFIIFYITKTMISSRTRIGTELLGMSNVVDTVGVIILLWLAWNIYRTTRLLKSYKIDETDPFLWVVALFIPIVKLVTVILVYDKTKKLVNLLQTDSIKIDCPEVNKSEKRITLERKQINLDNSNKEVGMFGKTIAIEKYIKSSEVLDCIEAVNCKEVPEVYGRDALIERCLQILLKYTKNNPLLIGPKGIGKKSIAYGVCSAIAVGKCPDELKGCKIFSIKLDLIAKNSVNTNDLTRRITTIIDDLNKVHQHNLILLIDNMQCILRNKYIFDSGREFIGFEIRRMLIEKKIRFLGIIDEKEYYEDEPQENSVNFVEPLNISEMTPEETMSILQAIKTQREQHYNITIPYKTIEAVVQLAHRYITKKFLPGTAIQLLDDSASSMRISIFGDKAKRVLSEEDISSVLARRYKIETNMFSLEKIKKTTNVADTMKANLIGQDHIVDAVLQTIQACRAGFGNTKRPDGVFYFVGPSGVGKTEFAIQLAKALYGGEDNLIRIDMSEYMQDFAISRLIGSPPGYVGYDQGGVLTEWIKKKPISVVLLDEFEKAHPRVFDIFLQLFDAGRLTDGKGQTADFSNATIIMTSNLGSEYFSLLSDKTEKSIGSKSESVAPLSETDILANIQGKIVMELKKCFRTEFLNRIDDILIFKPLKPEELKKIIPIMIKKGPIAFNFSDRALEYIANYGYDAACGARNLDRALKNLVIIPTSQLMADKKINKGDKVFVDLNDSNNITMRKM